MGDIFEEDFYEKVKNITNSKNNILNSLNCDLLDFESFNSEIKDAVEYLRPYVCDTLPILHEAIEK